jgi:exodeoxyribonuclease V gamma subunit
VAANFVRAYPGTLGSCVLAAGRDDPDRDPWTIDRLVWSVLAVTRRAGDDPGLAALHRLPAGASRYAQARRVADLFDRYHLHRPEMVRSWSAGEDVDGSGRRVSDAASWQPHLWRLVRHEVGQPSPPERWPGLLERVAEGDLVLDLPPRLVFFGFTLLPGGGFVDLARAVARHRDVHLFLLEPSRFDSGDLRRTGPHSPDGGPRLRADDSTAVMVEQPLLRSWGRLHRETAVLLAHAEAEGLPEAERVEVEDGPRRASLLDRLQRDIRSNAGPGEAEQYDPGDRSVQFHACFGATRQVEVLRDVLLHLLNDPGSDLCEDDILVVCPAIEAFAPLIQAVFGPSAESSAPPQQGSSSARGAPALRYRIADQSIRSTNPLLSATVALIELVGGRFEASAVLDFLALGPVRERFRFDDEELNDIADWVNGASVRWGLDPPHRGRFGIPEEIRTNTWQAALDRLLVGVTVHGDDLLLAVGDVAPYEMDPSATDAIGRLAEALWHLQRMVVETRTSQSLLSWVGVLRETCAALFATDRDGRWQSDALDRIFDGILDSATVDGEQSATPLDFVDVRRLIDERLESLPGRPDYFRGGITVSSLTPLRWIPFRVVCLLGMDQPAFGSMSAPGDDLAAAAPELGDPEPRAEMRQSLLEAVLSAGDHLVVLRDGHDVRTNQEVPRAVVVAELFDAVTSLVAPDHRPELAGRLEIHHPRQPFDPRCFEKDALVPGMPWGFDTRSLDGARARREPAGRPPLFLSAPLGPVDEGVVELDQLRRFFRNPSAFFVGQRLGARLPEAEEEPSSLLPVDLIGLVRWQVATRMLDARMGGVTTDRWRAVERKRGTLPPGSLEDLAVEAIEVEVDALVGAAAARGVGNGPAEPFDIDVELADGTRVVGSVPLRLRGASRGPARVGFSHLKPEYRIHAWLDLMSLGAACPSERWRSVAMGRADKAGLPADVLDIGIAGDASTWSSTALGALAVAVDCFRKGMREPIPFFPGLSYAVYRGTVTPGDWSTKYPYQEGGSPSVVLAHGRLAFNEVMSLESRPGDPGDAGHRVSRFADYLFGAMDDSTATWSAAPSAGAASRPE